MNDSKKTVKVALGVGSNIGDAEEHIGKAAELLQVSGFKNLLCSSLFITKPVDCEPGTPDFTNCVFVGEWNGSAEELLNLTQSIEVELGRPAVHRSDEARVIDLDILLFGDKQLVSERLTIPHPRMCDRLFVIEPLNELAKDWQIPGHGSVRSVLINLKGE